MEKRPREAGCDLGFKLSSRAAIWGVLAMGTSILLASGCKEEKKSRRSATEVVRPKKTPIERPVICINGELGAKKNEVDKRIGPMLTGAGARVVRVNPDNFQQEQENCDALFLTGGADLDPKLYGGSMHPSIKLLDPKRQAFDFEAIRKAEAEKKRFSANV